MTMETKQKRYGTLDGLRAYAAIGVALMHVLANGEYGLTGFFSERVLGSLGELVYLFMMLSGFSMCCGYYDKILRREISPGEFYGKRYAKIWPFFALLCLIDLAVSPGVEALYEVFANLTLCFGLLPNANISVIGVGWFLGVVFVFYLIFPFFCWLLSDRRRAWLAFCVALVFNVLCEVYFFDGAHVVPGFDYRSNFLYCAVYFLGGGLIFLYRDWLSALCARLRAVIFLACVAMAAVFFAFGRSVATGLPLAALLLIYAIGDFRRAPILENKLTHFVGGISMEIYLCHMLIFRVLERLGLVHLFGDPWLSYVTAAALTLGGAVAFSMAVRRIFGRVTRWYGRIKNKC